MSTEESVVVVIFCGLAYFMFHLLCCMCLSQCYNGNKRSDQTETQRATPETRRATPETLHHCHLCDVKVRESEWVDGSHRWACKVRNRERLQSLEVEPGLSCGVCWGTIRRWDLFEMPVSIDQPRNSKSYD